jgi:hypothetical protein
MAKLEIDLSPAEKTSLSAQADQIGVSLAEFVRRKAVSDTHSLDLSDDGPAKATSGNLAEAFWLSIQRRGTEVPASEWEGVPTDGAINHRHYSDGDQKKDQ